MKTTNEFVVDRRVFTDALFTLERAQELIALRGWTKHTTKDAAGRVCLLGALEMADGPGRETAKRILMQCIGTAIPTWNDRSATTLDDVNTLLRAAQFIAKELAE